uniref:Cytochrome P450 82A3 n=1 Tax=Cajanus cajan TaxID=3821 RepID=A0A151TC12_CAJCA|nr:Cytochrome P450 82A3 [Cajanus cajan]
MELHDSRGLFTIFFGLLLFLFVVSSLIRGQNFELIPFGSGRRSCPGMSFALQVLHLTLARLLHAFDFGTPSDQPVDMTESPGLTIPKATPLEVLLTPRLPPKLYAY